MCTLHKPDRDIWGTCNIRVPEDAPQAVVDLIKACRHNDPRQRPTIAEVCDMIDNIEDLETRKTGGGIRANESGAQSLI